MAAAAAADPWSDTADSSEAEDCDSAPVVSSGSADCGFGTGVSCDR